MIATGLNTPIAMTRTDLINHLVSKYKLERYLEIGVQNKEQNFNHINAKSKYGVDPCLENEKYGNVVRNNYCQIFSCTSDDFFKNRNKVQKTHLVDFTPFDIIFIDGLHEAEQVEKDFLNAFYNLRLGGFIILHDCNPEKQEHTLVPRPTKTGHWNGDVYQFASKLFLNQYHTVDIDNGCGVFYKHSDVFKLDSRTERIPWRVFQQNRKDILNLISWDEFLELEFNPI